jgi:molybdate transport system substrate-binding protein
MEVTARLRYGLADMSRHPLTSRLRSWRRSAGLLLLLAAACLVPAGGARAEQPVVAAASSLQFVMQDVAAAFGEATGERVRLSYGASGNLARQIRQGAPFEIFLAADESYVRDLAADGFTKGQGDLYGIGRLVMLVPEGSPLKPDGSLADLKAAVDDGRLKKFAIANPDHAPYGERAREALESVGLWQAIQPHLVFGENISQAAQFALSGATQGGLIAYSLALTPELSARGRHGLVDAGHHRPLRQRMALLEGAGATAERFYDFLRSKPARQIFRRHGFLLPGEGT